MSHKTVTLDVREDLRNGREPFSRIMSAAAGLQADEDLLLIAPFEPVPLFAVMGKRGFQHAAKTTSTGDWEVLFSRRLAGEEVQSTMISGASGAPVPSPVLEVDARGFEPPQPMVKILETLETLPPGAGLQARTDRRPLHLYPHLEERGFTAYTEEQSDGSFLTHIQRR